MTTLRIRFSGLCLFVRDRANKEVNVTFPMHSGTHTGHAHHEHHVPVLLFDTAHLVNNASKRDGTLSQVMLETWKLSLPKYDGEPVYDFCAGVVDLTAVTSGKAETVQTDHASKIIAQVPLSSGRMARVKYRGCWKWSNKPDRIMTLANAVEWQIEMPSSSLTGWKLEGLRRSAVRPLPDLHPINNTIDLTILNVPRAEIPPVPHEPGPPQPGKAPHFHSYFDVMRIVGEIPPELHFDRPTSDCDPDPGNVSCDEMEGLGLLSQSAYTCMVAAADTGP